MKYYFTFPEMIKTASHHKNCPSTFEQIENLLNLVKVLQRVRIQCGCPIKVNSAYRSPDVNAHVGGVVRSKHLDGKAADLTVNWLNFATDFNTLCRVCKEFRDNGEFSELIIHERYIHVAI